MSDNNSEIDKEYEDDLNHEIKRIQREKEFDELCSTDNLLMAISEEYWREKLQPVFDHWRMGIQVGLSPTGVEEFFNEIIETL
jgi:hypothetical protein